MPFILFFSKHTEEIIYRKMSVTLSDAHGEADEIFYHK